MNRYLIIIFIVFSLVYNGYSQEYLTPVSEAGIQHYIKLFNGVEETTVVQYLTSKTWYSPYYGFRIAKDNNLYEIKYIEDSFGYFFMETDKLFRTIHPNENMPTNQKRLYMNPEFAISIQKLFLAATDTITTKPRFFPCDGVNSIFIANGEDKILRAGAIGCPSNDMEVLINICDKIFKMIVDGKEEDQDLKKEMEILIEKMNARKWQ